MIWHRLLFIIAVAFCDLARRNPECTEFCFHHRLVVLPFLSSLQSPEEFNRFQITLLEQLQGCTKTSARFSLSIVLPNSREKVRCCNEHECVRLIANNLHLEHVRVEQTGLIDVYDINEVYKEVNEELMISKHDDKTSVFLLTDYFVPKLIYLPGIRRLNVMLLGNRSHQVTEFSKLPMKDVSIVTENHAGHFHMTRFCKVSLITEECPTRNETIPSEYGSKPVDLRMFLGFASREHYEDIHNGVKNILTDRRMDTNIGRITIDGPRKQRLATCTWSTSSQCLLYLERKAMGDIHVSTDGVSKDDIEFAPDVFNYMRDEAMKNPEDRETFVLILNDFVSVEFVENNFYFRKAMTRQRMSLAIGVILGWHGIDDQTAHRFYSNITKSSILHTLSSFRDLGSLMDQIVTASLPHGDTTTIQPIPSAKTTLLSTVPPTLWSGTNDTTTSATSRKIMTTTSSTTTTTTTIVATTTSNIHEDDVVLIVELNNPTQHDNLTYLIDFLIDTSSECVTPVRSFALWQRGVKDPIFCQNETCLEEEFRTLFNVTFKNDTTYEDIKDVLTFLKPTAIPRAQMPSIFLVTNYVSTDFLKRYDDRSDLRFQLSHVDFQVLLINDTDTFHTTSSLPNKDVHLYTNFSNMTRTPNYFCREYDEPKTTTESSHADHTILIFAVITSISLALIVVAITYCRYKITNRERDRKWQFRNLLRDSQRIKEVENGYKEYLNSTRLDETAIFNVTEKCLTEDPWEMCRQQIIMGPEMGRGSSGVVYRGSILGRAPCEFIHRPFFFAYQYDNCPVAIKVALTGSDDRRKQLLDEIEIMKAIHPHHNIANMLGCVTSYNPICLIIEFASGGSMKDFISEKSFISMSTEPCNKHEDKICERDVLSFMWQIADGLSFIHQCGVIHRDVAARNVLLEKGRNVMLSDFGLAIWSEDKNFKPRDNRLPVKWLPPEAHRGRFSEFSDVWSFGVCAWEMLTCGEEPYFHVPAEEILSYINSGRRLERPVSCEDDRLWNIITSCWMDEPLERPSFSELKTQISGILEELTTTYGYIQLVSE